MQRRLHPRPARGTVRRTTNNRSVRIIKGTLVAQPYATSVKGKAPQASAFGEGRVGRRWRRPGAWCGRGLRDAAGSATWGSAGSTRREGRGQPMHSRRPGISLPTPPPPTHHAQHKHPAGAISTILNPPNKERSSTYSACYNETSRTAQTAGTVHKRPVPYTVGAGRNRLAEPDAKPKTSTSISFDMGVVNKSTHPYRTVKTAMEAPTVLPMEARRGFTNPFITAEMTKRWHAAVWAQ